ncbi:MAG: hypothetical protein EA371_08350 [Gammaproteobacteria bacterium]|nr:MAG: hypothetical protein EA371_08350 [Gammaproteobacteria bacterium]
MLTRLLCLVLCAIMVVSPVAATAGIHGDKSTDHATAGASDCPGHAVMPLRDTAVLMADAEHFDAPDAHGVIIQNEACSQACELACALAAQLGSALAAGPLLPCSRQGERSQLCVAPFPSPAGKGPFRPPRILSAH